MTAGDADWSVRRPLVLGAMTVALVVGGFGAWSMLTTLAGAIIAPGLVEVADSRPVVQHPDGGVVEAILVAEGDRVAAGDLLLRLDGSQLRSEHAIIATQLAEIDARRARLEAQRDGAAAPIFPAELLAAGRLRPETAGMIAGQTGLFARQAEAVAQATDQRRQRIAQIQSQIEGIMAQHMAIKTQIRLLEGDFAAKSDLLDRGLTPGDRVLALERDLAALRGRLGELAALKAEARGRITEIEIEITALATQSREAAEAELRDLVAQRIALAERAAALGLRIARLDLRAPAAGLVFGLRVTGPGAVLRPAEAVLSIVPQDRPLLVAARVPVTDVEEVRPGQEVRLVFSALPARTAPELVGRVTRISADRLTDTQTGQSYFRAEIAIGAEVLNGLGGARVLPGMPVDAFIRTADRSPLSYLLQPFTTYFRHAFRET